MSKKTRYTSQFADLSPGDQVGGYHIYSTTRLRSDSGLDILLFIVHQNAGKSWSKGKGFRALYHKEPFRGALQEIKPAEKLSLRLTLAFALMKLGA